MPHTELRDNILTMDPAWLDEERCVSLVAIMPDKEELVKRADAFFLCCERQLKSTNTPFSLFTGHGEELHR